MTAALPRPDITPAADAADWWRGAVTYQLYIRSFADADGDGLGDIAGIRSRLPYLVELGVDAIWINPWFPSPQADGGYDVSDYRSIDPAFGTLDEAQELIDDTHAAGLKVLLDIVPNHTSDEHAWFAAALAAGPGSAERVRYHFRPGRGADGAQPPNDWQSVFGQSAWERVNEADGTPSEWYLHLFHPKQPDLNWANPVVREEFLQVLVFWFDRGADGFRIDVAHGLAKDPDLPDLIRDREELLGAPDRATTRTGTAPRCTRSTGTGATSRTATTRRRCSWPKRGCSPPTGSPPTCARTNCTPPSTSTFSARAGTPRGDAAAARHRRHRGPAAGPAAGPGGGAFRVGAARRGVPLPGRGAGTGRGRGPAGVGAGRPGLGALRAHRARS
ncbi:MAG TPA: alpha-amylase family glycosyl hydrolase [Actinomycetes bacterium]|nr:alpha-amylase family glycosyl hydrolase [Actinomycetes bacterium]